MTQKIKFFSILGARPQFVKASSITRAILKKNLEKEIISETVIHTGQHYDQQMSDIFFQELNITQPSINLNIGGGSHGENTGRMIEGLEKIFIKELPDLIVVYGDTDTTLSASIAASKLNIPIVHIEAGLRSWNRRMPEEINRVITDHLSDYLFCPSKLSVNNLIKEGIAPDKIFNFGDVMYDNFLYFKQFQTRPSCLKALDENFAFCTIHRKENTDNIQNLIKIFDLLSEISTFLRIVFPVHPRTKKILLSNNITLPPNIILEEPFGMFETYWCLSNCNFVITDSGGLQKEAFFAQKRCVTLRDETEWMELVDLKANYLVSPQEINTKEIFNFVEDCLDESIFSSEPYGDGTAANKIIDTIIQSYS